MKKNHYFVIDGWLLWSVLAVVIIGLIMVASASMVISYQHYGHAFHFLLRQFAFVALGSVVAIAVMFVDSSHWQRWGPRFLLLGLLLLLLVLLPGLGHTVNGSRRWLNLPLFPFQVSELMKLAMIVYLSGYLVRRQQEVSARLRGLLKPLFLLAVVAVLLLAEPDFGATTVIVFIVLGLLFLGGVRLVQFFPFLLGVAGLFGLIAVAAPYRLARLTAFLDPWARPYDSGYQLTQSLMAFGRGGVFGVGLGNSIQKLFYLPEAHTDFLFAVLAEEFGLLGQCVVVALFAVIVARAFLMGRAACQQDRLFLGYMAYGIGLWIAFQVWVNIGVNAGLLPTKGLTLPLMSYGGSSLLCFSIAIGLLFRIYHELNGLSHRGVR